MTTSADREVERLLIQAALDYEKPQEERNRLGQFATPPSLARDVVCEAIRHLPSAAGPQPLRVLDPALGTGAFWSAIRSTLHDALCEGVGFEIDKSFADASRRLWVGSGLDVRCGDFTKVEAPTRESGRFDLIVCNPPYVRHHHLSRTQKAELRRASAAAAGVRFSGLAGLYCHFIALAHSWMRRGAVAVWLVPSEFMDVNYGAPLKEYLLGRVTLLRIHQFEPDDVQFADALVSSAVVVIRNEPPPGNHVVEFSQGSTLANPVRRARLGISRIGANQRWTQLANGGVEPPVRDNANDSMRLGDLFTIRRGLVTGGNDFFVLSEEQIDRHQLPRDLFVPILPSPRYLRETEVHALEDGSPDLQKRRFLLNCDLPEEEVAEAFPSLWTYLSSAPQSLRERYICRHRTPWYRQERRPAAPLLCTYLGRPGAGRRPFRFVLNHSNATAANVYHLLYPLPRLASAMESDSSILRRIWAYLNSVDVQELLRQSRVYGGGLHKLEPSELARVSLAGMAPELDRAIAGAGVRQYPATELGATHQLLEGVQLYP